MPITSDFKTRSIFAVTLLVLMSGAPRLIMAHSDSVPPLPLVPVP